MLVPYKPFVTPAGHYDEGVMMVMLVTLVFLFVGSIEYVRFRRAKASDEKYANAAVWGVMLTLAAGGYVAAPYTHLRHDISILMTCGAAMQMLAFFLLWAAPRRTEGESLPRAPADFTLLMALALCVRIYVEMKWNGYLPVDRTGDGCIQLFEFIALMLTVHGLGRTRVEPTQLRNALLLGVACVFFGQFCHGDMDVESMPDKGFAVSIYCELFAWVCMTRYVFGRGKNAVNSMMFPPSFVQAMCRAYFWYSALPETKVRAPNSWVQAKFNVVLVAAHVGMAIAALAMSAFTIREIKPETILVLPHELASELKKEILEYDQAV